MPIKIGNEKQCNEIKTLVKALLEKEDDTKVRRIDDLVYEIYGITEYEVPIIEG